MANELAVQPKQSALWASFGQKYEIEASQVGAVLRNTILKTKPSDQAPTNEEVAAFIVVCNQYDLNPFTKEIFGFISKGKMQYVVSVDGWATLLNRQPNLNGIEFEEHFAGEIISAITCKIHRKDRTLPTVITEYFSECRGTTDTWAKWPIRMLRHKALIQCARLAFGLAGIMDEDEAERRPGFVAPQMIAGNKSNIPQEAAEMMQRLGYAPGKKSSLGRTYADRPEELLAYLRGELAKMSSSTSKQAAATVEGKSEEFSYAEEDQRPNQDVEHVETHTDNAVPTNTTQPANGRRRDNW